jgi:hypothetical protein
MPNLMPVAGCIVVRAGAIVMSSAPVAAKMKSDKKFKVLTCYIKASHGFCAE